MKNKDAYYFSHDSNARHDPKIMALIEEYGLTGYAYFFTLIEILREQKNYILPFYLVNCLAKEWQTHNSPISTERILQSMVQLQLLNKNDIGFFSPSLCDRMLKLDEMRKKRSDAGMVGAKVLWQTHSKRMANAKQRMASKVKESKENKSKEKEIKQKQLITFEHLWNIYPRRLGKDDALRHYTASIKTKEDYDSIQTALNNYIKYIELEKLEERFIQHGSTWFNNKWKDWINPPVSKKDIVYERKLDPYQF